MNEMLTFYLNQEHYIFSTDLSRILMNYKLGLGKMFFLEISMSSRR